MAVSSNQRLFETPRAPELVLPTKRAHDPVLWSTLAIALLLAVTAVAGLFWPATYARETAYSRAGGVASDLVNLLLVLPVLLISGTKAYRGSLPARLVWLGVQGYLLYNFVIYAFGVHFNALFLVYCATLGLCFYAAIFNLPLVPAGHIARVYGPHVPRWTVAIIFFALAFSTAVPDLRENILAILAGRVPESITQANQPVNFVHVLDLVFLLPALCITAALLLRRKPAGYVLAPVFLTLLAVMSLELVSIIAIMGRQGSGMNVPMISFFLALAAMFTLLLWLCLRPPSRSA